MKLSYLRMLAFVAWICASAVLQAQTELEPLAPEAQEAESSFTWFSMHGSIGLSAEYYNATSSADALGVPVWSPRRPANLYRTVFNSTITLFNEITIPVQVVLNSTETNTITPATASPTLAQFFTNPLNALSLSIRPGVDWAELQLGTHLPEYTDLVGSQVQIFGGGFKATPSVFRLGFNTGIVQRAVAADTLSGNVGAYRRFLTMGKFGIGNENKWFIDISAVAMRDDTAGLAPGLAPSRRILRQEVGLMDTLTGETPTTETVLWDRLPAEEGVMASLAFRAELNDMVAVVGEVAGSARTRDLRSDPIKDLPSGVPSFLYDLFLPRDASSFDGATSAGLLLKQDDWGVDLRAKYYGPGFTSFSIPFMQSDYLDLTVSPRFTTLENRITFNGTFGQRTTNFSSNTGDELRQIIISANLSLVLTDEFNISGTFNNYGIRNGIVNDTFRIQNVSQSIIVTPSLFLVGTDLSHSISVSGSMDSFDDFNAVSGRFSTNNTYGAFGNYTAAWTTMPLVLYGGINYLRNNLEDFGFTMANVNVGGSYGFFENKVVPNISVSVGQNTLANQSADLQVVLRVGARWQITEQLSFNASTSTNSYRYGSSNPGARFAENTTQFMLVQSF